MLGLSFFVEEGGVRFFVDLLEEDGEGDASRED